MFHSTKLPLAVLALASLGLLIALIMPQPYNWRGDGLAAVNGAKPVRAAMLAHRREGVFGLYKRFSYQVAQFDRSDNTYVTLVGCHVEDSTPARCFDNKKRAYWVRVTQAPSYNQVMDDDGVDVGN